MDIFVSRAEFDTFCDKQYPPQLASKTMRRDRVEKIARYLKGLEPAPVGSWRYRIQEKGYALASFPALGLTEVLCLKGAEVEGVIEKGVYGEWRKVVPVEEFYDVLLDAHVRIQGHGGYKNLLRAVELNYAGVPREAAVKFVALCCVCQNNPRQRLRTAKATEANRGRTVKVPCVTNDFNMRCQIDLMDMSQNPDGDYTHIGLYTDHWTKFITLFPMMGCSPEHVAYGLASSVFPYYGPPRYLHSSDGKEFGAEVVRLSFEKWKGGERTAVPQAKPGLQLLGEVVEGTKDNLIKMINSRALEEHVMGPIPWASWLGKIMFDMNSQPNSDTGKSPYSRVFERTIGMPDSGEPAEPLRDFALGGHNRQEEKPLTFSTEVESSSPPKTQQMAESGDRQTKEETLVAPSPDAPSQQILLQEEAATQILLPDEASTQIVLPDEALSTQIVLPDETESTQIVLPDEADAMLPLGATEIYIDNPVVEEGQTYTTVYVDSSGGVQSFIISVQPADT